MSKKSTKVTNCISNFDSDVSLKYKYVFLCYDGNTEKYTAMEAH